MTIEQKAQAWDAYKAALLQLVMTGRLSADEHRLATDQIVLVNSIEGQIEAAALVAKQEEKPCTKCAMAPAGQHCEPCGPPTWESFKSLEIVTGLETLADLRAENKQLREALEESRQCLNGIINSPIEAATLIASSGLANIPATTTQPKEAGRESK